MQVTHLPILSVMVYGSMKRKKSSISMVAWLYLRAYFIVNSSMLAQYHHRPRGIILFMLNSTEHEILTAHKTKMLKIEDFLLTNTLVFFYAYKC